MKTIAYWIIISITLAACNQKTKLVELAQNNSGTTLGLTLNSQELKLPFSNGNTNGGSINNIYYETGKARHYLPGNIQLSGGSDSAMLVWENENRKLSLTFQKRPGGISFLFKSVPDDGILKWGMSVSANEKEYFTGLFERTVDGLQTASWAKGIKADMNLRGQKVKMLIQPTLGLYCPFYVSSSGYGLFIEGTWPGNYDFCQTENNKVKIEFEGTSLAGMIYISNSPAEIVKRHSLHVGPTIVPPKWAFLPWRWRDNHDNKKTYYDNTVVNSPYNSMLTEDILMMKAFDIPCGLYWVDRPWAKGHYGYEDFEWDPQRFPNASEMIQWLHADSTRFLLWIGPWVVGKMRDTAIARKYNIPAMKDTFGVSPAIAADLDFTNPEACRWWQSEGIEKMIKQGVDGFKLDRADETVPERLDVTFFNGKTSREERNNYPVNYVRTVNEICRKLKGDDFILIPRAGYTGSSKYSGFWGGDIGSEPEALRAAIIALQRSSIIGFPVWGSDIGGYWQGDLDREVCARWLAFGCFNPIMEVGPTEDRGFWDMDSEPAYDTMLIATWRLYAKLKEKLADYSHQAAVEANKTGMPIVRPLFIEYSDQQEAWTEWQTFKYGPDILVTAIWQKGAKSYKTYLPKGEDWIDVWTNTVYHGGNFVETPVTIYQIPIFIRKGSQLNFGDMNKLYIESYQIASIRPDLKALEKKYITKH